MTLLVYRIHSANFPLFWFLSFFFKITSYEITPFLGRFKSKRIKLLGWENHFTSDEMIYLRSEALKAWEKILPDFPVKSWKLHYDGELIDFSKKGKQELGNSFEHVFLFRQIQTNPQVKSKLYIIASRQFSYISKVMRSKVFSYDTLSFLSWINVILDNMQSYYSLVRRLSSLSYLTLKTFLIRNADNKIVKTPSCILWDAVNPNEMYLSQEKRAFPWIIDGCLITDKHVVFLTPPVHKKVVLKPNPSPYQAFTISSLYRVIPKGMILKNLWSLFSNSPRLFISSLFKYESMATAHYSCDILLYEPLISYLTPACYVTSLSSLGSENPAIEYFNAKGIRTIMYSYSSSAHFFLKNSFQFDFRAIIFANIISSSLIVWNRQYKKFIEEHPQEGLDVNSIGPLMAGNDKVFEDVDSLRRSYHCVENQKEGSLKYVTVFDMAMAITGEWRLQNLTRDTYPHPFNEEYCTAFMKDMFRLLSELRNIVVVFKPQRNLFKKKFFFPTRFVEAVSGIENSGRGIVIDDDVNPWVPIALADLCIGMPFTSPITAAMHYGKPAFFHDPTGIARNHRYQSISEYVTHGYDELKSRVEEILFGGDKTGKNTDPWFPAKMGFAGSRPGINSSDEFRKYLSALSRPDI